MLGENMREIKEREKWSHIIVGPFFSHFIRIEAR
jgi:hypothetical protein